MTVLSNLFYILIALVVLMFMITVHELGHYIAGRILGFKINEFSIGMGPKIFSKRLKNDQIFSLRWLPLGGYCAFEGEDEDNPSPQAFNNQKPWKRIIVLFSGAFMNFISALIIVIIAFSCFGDYLPTIVSMAVCIDWNSPRTRTICDANAFKAVAPPMTPSIFPHDRESPLLISTVSPASFL